MIESTVALTDGITCHIYGGAIEEWLTKVLGIYATLARRTNQSQMTLANEGAFLLVYEESVRAIRSNLTEQENITHQRFRPNLVVDKDNEQYYPKAYSEDQWTNLFLNDNQRSIEWKTMGVCQRCSVVNVDPDTGKNQSRLFTRLQTERREPNRSRANFGILLNLSQISENEVLRVGDHIRLLHR